MFGNSKIFVALTFIFTFIFATTAFADYERVAENTVPAYHDANLTQRTGNERVDKGDRVIVHQETANAYEVTYPTPRGPKRRWIPKNIFPPPVPNNLQSLINEYNGKTWVNHTYNPNVKECKEFAAFIFDRMYGVGYIGGGSVSSNPKNYLINLATNRVALRGYRTNLTAQSARELFQNARSGDFVQIRRRHGGPHSGIFVDNTGNGIRLFEANADGRNSIRVNSYSYDDLANKNFAMSLYYAR